MAGIDLTGGASSADFAATWSHESENPFLERYSQLDPASWEEKSVAAIHQPVQDGIRFPDLPPDDLQMQLHGQAGEPALREIFHFHKVISAYCRLLQLEIHRDSKVLDFGTGWGRALWPFMAKVSLRNLYGYESTPMFCRVARMLNPYVSFINGELIPPTPLSAKCFDIVLSWSTFAHMPPQTTQSWLKEFARILRPGALLFMTFWGDRFVLALKEAEKTRRAGGAIHWFHQQVLDEAGDVSALEARCNRGEAVFVPSSRFANWGNTFVSAASARGLEVRGMSLVKFDSSLLAQDLAVFRRDA